MCQVLSRRDFMIIDSAAQDDATDAHRPAEFTPDESRSKYGRVLTHPRKRLVAFEAVGIPQQRLSGWQINRTV
jgi:hypothetical protein